MIVSSLLVGWTSTGCVVVDDTPIDPTDTVTVQDTTAEEDTTVDEDVVEPSDVMEEDASSIMFELVGDWSTNYGESYSITNEMWGPSSIHAFDNEENWAVTQYSEEDEWNPNLFAKQVWTEIDDMGFFYQCTVLFSADTFEEALNTEDTADASNPAEGGCAGFKWTQFGPPGAFDE